MRLFIFSVITVFFFAGCQEPINPRLQIKNANKMTVYPNPASTYIYIDAYTNSNPVHCEVKILDGKNTSNVFSGEVNQINLKVDISNYKSQSVLVQILMGNSLEERQVIIEK
jgi:hypothetical protein